MRRIRVIVCNEAFENLQASNVDVDFFAPGLELLVEIFTERVRNVGMNGLKWG